LGYEEEGDGRRWKEMEGEPRIQMNPEDQPDQPAQLPTNTVVAWPSGCIAFDQLFNIQC